MRSFDLASTALLVIPCHCPNLPAVYLALVLVLVFVFVVLAFVVLAVMPTNLKGVDIDAERHFFRI